MTSGASTAAVACPVCLRRQPAPRADVLCAACANAQLEPLRNSCVSNDVLNSANRNNINAVFAACRGALDAGDATAQTLQTLCETLVPPQSRNTAPSALSVKHLALQLLKLELINANVVLRNIEKSRDSTQQKVIDLNEQIVTVENDANVLKERIQSVKSDIATRFHAANATHTAEYVHLKREKILQIEKQALQLQHTHYKILKELCFSTARSNTYTAKFKSPSTMLLFSQPVIRIEQFFGYNNKLFQLNEYLENLILLQVHLRKVFGGIQLPYIDELEAYLPDKEFYGLVQKKENFMVNGGEPDVDDDDDEAVAPIEVNEIDSNERIIKLGNTIKLPLSSKTINNQLRRASKLKPSDVASIPEIDPKVSPPTDVNVNKLAGKKMIIVPHRILTKPFTKLDSKEYLRFLAVVVKILVNFRVFLSMTADTVPRSTSFVTTTLTNTVNQLRNKAEEKDLSAHNLEKILNKINSLDEYFTHRVNQVQYSKESAQPDAHMTQSQVATTSTSHSASTSSSPLLSYVQDSKEWKEAKNYTPEHGLKALYKMLTEKTKEKPNEEIYGAFSAHGPHDRSGQPLAALDRYSAVSADPDLKATMQDIHHLMINGHSKMAAKSHSTTTMMAQSRAQLDDWDVISKMYHI